MHCETESSGERFLNISDGISFVQSKREYTNYEQRNNRETHTQTDEREKKKGGLS